MSKEFEIKCDEKSLTNLYNGLKKYPKVANKAVLAAINRTVQKATTEAQKNITKIYNIKKKDLNGGGGYKGESSNNLVKAHKATGSNLSAYVDARGSSLTLYRFVTGSKTPINKKGYRIKVKVTKGKTKSLSRHSFINTSNGGNYQLFHRGNTRDIDEVMHTTSVASMAANEKVVEPTQAVIKETLEKRAAHELEYRLSKIRG